MAKLATIWDGNSHGAERPRVSVIIPALNEERNLPFVAAKMPEDVDEIVFVNGNSVDNTAVVARELWPDGVHVAQTRKGKGNALACGFEAASGDIIVMIDADGSTDPQEIPSYVGALVAGADFAKGSRFIQGGGSADITHFRRLGNWGLNANGQRVVRDQIHRPVLRLQRLLATLPRRDEIARYQRSAAAVGRRIRNRNPHQRSGRREPPEDRGSL